MKKDLKKPETHQKENEKNIQWNKKQENKK